MSGQSVWKRGRRRRADAARSLAIAGAVLAGASAAHAQIATLDKGHALLVDSGLQMWGLNTDSFQYSFNYNNLTNLNLNAVMWSFGQSNTPILASGQQWGKWVDYLGNPATALNASETAHYADLVAIQVGDEQQADLESPTSATTVWFQNARAGNHFNDKLLYVNSTFINSDGAYATFIANANPDAISWDAYPFGTTGVFPNNWLGKAQQFRRHALGSYINSGSGNAPRPYGLYLQTYHAGDGARDPGDVEMRWQQFTAWTLGYTFVDCFTYGGGNTSLFVSGDGNTPNQPLYNQFKESARQSRNLGPALVRLISYSNGPAGGGTSIVLGKNSSGVTNPLPISWQVFNQNDAPPNQRYLTSVSATNLGTKNGGQPGDVYIGFFNPLHLSYGDPAGTTYFMVTNALGAYLQDATALASECVQEITLNFDFQSSGISSLQRLRRSDGQVEVVPLTHLGGSQYRLIFELEGGTGDLFKYNDGSPFVGIEAPAFTLYWDNDGNAANNNIGTGAGMGGTGSWDGSAKWYNGVSNAPWAANQNAVFWGAAGTVTLSSPQSANSLTFKTSGYTITGAGLTLAGPVITVDAGVSATISSQVSGSSGLVKNGPGTLNLAVNNNYTGGTTINEGVLGIISGAVGANPPSPQVNVTINNGSTPRFNQNNLVLTAQRQILLGPGGGVIDTAFNNGISGAISGTTLTKTGTGTLTLSAANSHAATVIAGGAIVVTSDANLGAVPAALSANITLDGGTLRWGAVFDLANARAITLEAAGGTIDTQAFGNSAGYAANEGFRGSGDLTKIGSGTFIMATPMGQLNSLWLGNLILKEGTWKTNNTGGLPANPSTGGLRPGQVTFDGGTLQINASINVSQPNRGITVGAGGGVINTQGFNVTWAGPISGTAGAATLTKIGSGLLRLGSTYASTYIGNLHVAEGTLQLNGGSAMGDLASVSLANAPGVTLNVTGNETIGSLSGGGATGGNVTLNTFTLTTGGNDNSTSFAGVISGSGGITKAGAGTMTLSGANTYAGATTVNGGMLVLAQSLTASSSLSVVSGASTQLSPGTNKVLTTGSVTLTGTARLDLADNKAIITLQPGGLGSWNGTAYTGVLGLVQSGRGDGSWNGSGIITSMSDATGGVLTTLAVALAEDVGHAGGTFGGQSVTAGDVLVMYTWGGDAQMDGDLDGDDYFQIDSNVAQSGSVFGFHKGDFNYDGLINGDDYFIIDSNIAFAQSQPDFPTDVGAGGALTAVPEPGGMIALAALAGLARRGRRA